jgi:lipopolysaccharide export system ATP-binding protein
VRDVQVDLASGEIVGLLGANGAGKTTTFRMVVGLVGPDSGRVLLDDHDVTNDPMYIARAKGIGYLPQEPSIFRGLTVEQNILAILETLPIIGATRRARLRSCSRSSISRRSRESKAYHAFGRRAAARRKSRARSSIGRNSCCSTSRFAGIDPIAVRKSRRSSFTSRAGHRRSGHRPQRPGDPPHHRSGLYRPRWRDFAAARRQVWRLTRTSSGFTSVPDFRLD